MYEEERALLQEMAQEAIVELYKMQFLARCAEDPTEFFIKNGLENKVVQLDDVGKGYEALIITLGWRAILNTKKYARVARVFIPALRKIYWKGHMQDEAQKLLHEMMLQSTIPFNDLDKPMGGSDYTELDSYIGIPLDSLTVEMERQDLGDRAAPIVPHYQDAVTGMICEAYEGYEREQALNASRFNLDISDDEWYDEGEITSVPIYQENEMMLHLDMQEVYRLIHTFRTIWGSYGKERLYQFIINGTEEFLPQNLSVVCASFQIPNWVLKNTPCEGYSSLLAFDKLFGDDCLDEFVDFYDEVTDFEGASREVLSEEEISDIADGWIRSYIDTFTGTRVQESKLYAEGVFNAIATNQANLNDAGWANWRAHKSPQGAEAFNFAYQQAKAEGANESAALKYAWQKFSDAGKILSINERGLRVQSTKTNKIRLVDWLRAGDEIATYLIRLGKDERERLIKILTEKGWGAELLTRI